jgi:hypothetical protein
MVAGMMASQSKNKVGPRPDGVTMKWEPPRDLWTLGLASMRISCDAASRADAHAKLEGAQLSLV